MHGREYQSLIASEVDLAAQPRTLAHASWIKPLERPLPGTVPREADAPARP